jgi:dephospho-CoA kinase
LERTGDLPLVIGLTGNIGSGKSTVLQMLAELGAQIIDADRLAHEVIAPDGPAYAAVVDTFGQDILKTGGHIDRSKLGDIVFRDPQALARLEALVHPAVFARTQELIEQAEAEVVVIEAIKLLESGMARRLCYEIWVVTCRPEQQRARVMAQRGLTEAQARLRIEAQPPQAEKIAQADVVIDNSGTMEETHRQVEAAWEKLMKAKEGKEGKKP